MTILNNYTYYYINTRIVSIRNGVRTLIHDINVLKLCIHSFTVLVSMSTLSFSRWYGYGDNVIYNFCIGDKNI